MTGDADDLIENSNLSSQRVRVTCGIEVVKVCVLVSRLNPSLCLWQEEMDRKEKMTAGLNQTVRELQQLLQGVSRQLAKGQEGVRPVSVLFLSAVR